MTNSPRKLEAKRRATPLALAYLFLSVLGACATWTFNTLWMQQVGRPINLLEFILVGYRGTHLLGSLASDFWVGSLASLIFMVVECRRLRMPRLWLYVVVTFVVAWACALPLFLFMRERRLMSQQPADEVRIPTSGSLAAHG